MGVSYVGVGKNHNGCVCVCMRDGGGGIKTDS